MLKSTNHQTLQEEIEATHQDKVDKEDWSLLKTNFLSSIFYLLLVKSVTLDIFQVLCDLTK